MSGSLLQKFCPDGFAFITPDGYFLSTCIREGIIALIPLIFYFVIGAFRFASLWDVPLWNKWYIHDFFLNKRISLIYKVSWVLRLLLITVILLMLNGSTLYSIFDATRNNQLANITYFVEFVKTICWVIVLINFIFETRRNLRTWWATIVFHIGFFLSSLFQVVFYLQSFRDPAFNVFDIRGFFFFVSFVCNFLLLTHELLGICFPILLQYKDPVMAERIKKRAKTGVNLRVRDVLELILMGWYFLVPGFLFATGQGAAAQFIAENVGKAIDAKDMNEVRSICSPFLYLIPIMAICTIFQMTFLGFGGETILMKMRNKLLGSFSKQDISFFQRMGIGYLVSRITTDCDIIGVGLTVHISALVPPGIAVITGFLILMKNSISLAILLITLLVTCFIITVLRSRIVTQRYSATYSDKRAFATRKATEVIQGMDVVKTFGKEKDELKNYKKLTQSQRVTGLVKEVLEACFEAAEVALNKSIIAIGVFVGSALVFNNHIDRSELSSFLLVGITTINEFYSFVKVLPELYNISAPTERVFTLMKLKPMTDMDKGDIIPPHEFKGKIEFENVTFAYPSADPHEEATPVINNVSLVINPGESVAFCGSSGSGKSTMLSLTIRFFDVQEGRILIDGRDIKSLKPRWWLEQLGIVAQQSLLFQGSIEENIKYSCKTKSDWNNDEAFHAAISLADANSVIDSHEEGILFNVGARGDALSGGQKQRVSIARMARKQPKILFLDEVTSALDPASEEIAMKGLRELAKGKTTLCVAHRLHTIMFCDKIVCMKKGRIVEQGSHDELMAIENGYYLELFSKQQQISNKEASGEYEEGYNFGLIVELKDEVSQLLHTLEAYSCFDAQIIKDHVKRLKSTLKEEEMESVALQARQVVDREELVSAKKGDEAPLLQGSSIFEEDEDDVFNAY